MWQWFWYFFIYSFLGFLLEVVFNRITGHVKRDRKCHYLLPLCPVYGLSAVALLLLPEVVRSTPMLLFPVAAVLCTAVEYLTGFFYQKVARVCFWDYSHLPLNIGGNVCLPFSLLWGALALVLYAFAQPTVAAVSAAIPPAVSLLMLAATATDGAITLILLRREGHTDALRWYDRVHLQKRTA